MSATLKKSPSKPRAAKPKKKPTWTVAVVVRRIHRTTVEEITASIERGIWLSNRNGSRGDWSAFLGTDRDKVIHHAQQAAEKWGGDEIYEVWVGDLTGLVQVPTPKYGVTRLTR